MHTHRAAAAWQMSRGSLSCNNSIACYHPNLESLMQWVGFFKGWGALAGPRRSGGVCRCSSPLKIKGFVQVGECSPVSSSGQPGSGAPRPQPPAPVQPLPAKERRDGHRPTQRNRLGFERGKAIVAQIMGERLTSV